MSQGIDGIIAEVPTCSRSMPHASRHSFSRGSGSSRHLGQALRSSRGEQRLDTRIDGRPFVQE